MVAYTHCHSLDMPRLQRGLVSRTVHLDDFNKHVHPQVYIAAYSYLLFHVFLMLFLSLLQIPLGKTLCVMNLLPYFMWPLSLKTQTWGPAAFLIKYLRVDQTFLLFDLLFSNLKMHWAFILILTTDRVSSNQLTTVFVNPISLIFSCATTLYFYWQNVIKLSETSGTNKSQNDML